MSVFRLESEYPGRFEQGPDEKLGTSGFTVGFMGSSLRDIGIFLSYYAQKIKRGERRVGRPIRLMALP
jgi:hypothetical protein